MFGAFLNSDLDIIYNSLDEAHTVSQGLTARSAVSVKQILTSHVIGLKHVLISTQVSETIEWLSCVVTKQTKRERKAENLIVDKMPA